MARGKHFNHKERGHEPTIPKHGGEIAAKNTEHMAYEIEPVASEETGPISLKAEK